jgi:probable HAF family extracellular repeat protein
MSSTPSRWPGLVGLSTLVFACCASSTPVSAAPQESPYFTITDLGTVDQVAADVVPGLNSKGRVSVWRLSDGTGYRPILLGANDMDTALDAPKGYENEFAYSLNDQDDAAGWANTTRNPVDSLSITHAVFVHKGVGVDLGTLGGRDSRAYAVNNAEVVVGVSQLAGNKLQRAFRYSKGKMETLEPLASGDFSIAFAVNEAGVAAGGAAIKVKGAAMQSVHAALWKGKSPQDLGVLVPGRSSVAYAVNDHNDVVGVADTKTSQTVFLYTQGRMVDLGIDGRAFSVNDNRQVVGTREGEERGYMVGWLWENGTTYKLNDCIPPQSGYWIVSGDKINNSGQIACTARLNKKVHVVLLTPAKRP